MKIGKPTKEFAALASLIILTGTASFGLGRLSIAEQYKNNSQATVIVPELQNINIDESNFKYLASKNGTKYYPIGCKSASRIKPENRVYFMTMEEAESEGLEKSSTCSF